MKQKFFIGIIITSITTLFTSISFAHDCNLVIETEKTLDNTVINYQINYKQFLNVLPTEAFRQALTNLKAYCCSQVTPKGCTEKEKNNLPKHYPESAYLFDQLIDVAMRRLDGYPSLAYGLDPDPTAKEWREYITQIATAPNGAKASDIKEKYTTYRKLHPFKTTDEVIKNYNKGATIVSLADKYNYLCDILKKIYDIQKENRTILGGSEDKNSFFSKCLRVTENKVKKENNYVKLLMTQKSNTLMDEGMKAYIQKHFVEEKLMNLWNIIVKVKDTFTTIVRQAPVAKSCSK